MKGGEIGEREKERKKLKAQTVLLLSSKKLYIILALSMDMHVYQGLFKVDSYCSKRSSF